MKRFVLALTALTIIALPTFAAGTQETGSKEPLVWVWYPNESTPEFAESRQALIKVASEALGREIKEQLTTDYTITIEALVNENAALSWLGGEGYTQTHERENAVLPVVVDAPDGDLNGAKYYSMLGTLVENENDYKTRGDFDLDTLRQKKFSFVSNSSTSGFRVPSSIISTNFNVEAEDLLEGGPNMVFSEVMFGGSHQGSFLNVLTGKADIGAFCNDCIDDYIDVVSGDFADPTPGDVIRVKSDAPAPFDSVAGKEVVLVATVPVLNECIVANTNLLTDEEFEALVEAYMSDAVTKDKAIFGPDGSNAIFEEGSSFVPVQDEWYDPIRVLSGLK